MATTESVKTNRFSDTFGYATGRAATKVVEYMSPYVQEFIKNSPLVIQASTDAEGNCDASPKGGKPGFVKVLDEKHLVFPDVAGNKLFQSYQNFDNNPHVGLLFLIPGVNDVVRVNGQVTIVDQEELERMEVEVALYEIDERSHHLQGIMIEVNEAYTHCPRALKFSAIWDVDKIAANKASRPISER
ncbi:MAG: pyridoxamine 5'-phosphate oxidase family protein [Chloroflexi bacterium]|nr:pyridoxamine 5'-phosphate oxidase family protein [Chloroflexota bacterium]